MTPVGGPPHKRARVIGAATGHGKAGETGGRTRAFDKLTKKKGSGTIRKWSQSPTYFPNITFLNFLKSNVPRNIPIRLRNFLAISRSISPLGLPEAVK